MRKSVCVKDDKSNKTLPWLPEFDRLLIAGIKHGPAMKKEAINKILQLAPHWTRGDCWRRIKELRRAAKRAALEERHPSQDEEVWGSYCSPAASLQAMDAGG